jgi:hypothetical protein
MMCAASREERGRSPIYSVVGSEWCRPQRSAGGWAAVGGRAAAACGARRRSTSQSCYYM